MADKKCETYIDEEGFKISLPTSAERERLLKLQEECAEVIQAASKVLRHGYLCYHPDDPSTDNRALLNEEVTDVAAVLLDMRNNYDLPALNVLAVRERIERKRRYDHFQS